MSPIISCNITSIAHDHCTYISPLSNIYTYIRLTRLGDPSQKVVAAANHPTHALHLQLLARKETSAPATLTAFLNRSTAHTDTDKADKTDKTDKKANKKVKSSSSPSSSSSSSYLNSFKVLSSRAYVSTDLVEPLIKKIFSVNEDDACKESVEGMTSCLLELAKLTKNVWDSALSWPE